LEGLEISEVLLSKVFSIETHRLDSEYQKKKYLEIQKNIDNKPESFTYFKNLGLKVDASAFYPSLEPYYGLGNFPFLRVADVDTHINYDNCIKIPITIVNDPSFNTLKVIHKGDIIITKGGSIGRVGLIEQDTAVTRDLIFINSSKLNSEEYKFLFLYLLSDISYDLMIRSSSMTAQPHLTIKLIRDLPIFISENTLKKEVSSVYDKSQKLKLQSKELYVQAENLLLEEIGLEKFTPSAEGINIKMFSKSFSSSGRLDAEFYQPKYDDYLSKVYTYENGYDSIISACNIKLKNFNPEDNKSYKYIELSNIGKMGDITGCTIDLGKELPSRARRKVNQGDVIVSSIEGSLDSSALVTEEYNDALCSTGFYVINSKKINSETLLVLFKSELMQNLLKQNCSGTILTSLNKDDFLNIPIPLIDNEAQKNIKNSINESFALKKQSEHLLEVAKRAVEIAIEEGEEIALRYINQNK
jgi:restriction endonuclease S subunit